MGVVNWHEKKREKNVRVKQKSTKGLALKVRHPEINIGNTRRNMSFYPRKDVTSKNFTSSLRPFN